MLNSWLNETDPGREEAMIDRLAEEVSKRGLDVPAVLFLEMHRPLANVAGHALLAASPFIAPFVGMDRLGDFSRLLANPANVARLIDRIETKATAGAG